MVYQVFINLTYYYAIQNYVRHIIHLNITKWFKYSFYTKKKLIINKLVNKAYLKFE